MLLLVNKINIFSKEISPRTFRYYRNKPAGEIFLIIYLTPFLNSSCPSDHPSLYPAKDGTGAGGQIEAWLNCFFGLKNASIYDLILKLMFMPDDNQKLLKAICLEQIYEYVFEI